MPDFAWTCSINRLQDDGTCTAAPFAASQLRPLQSMLGSNEVEQGPMRVWVRKFDLGSVEVEPQRGTGIGRLHQFGQLLVRGRVGRDLMRRWKHHDCL